MRVFRYAADRVPVFLFVCLFAVDLSVYLWVDHAAMLVLWFFAGILPKAAVCSFNHHHQHVPTFYAAPLNRCLELMYALHTGVTSHAWVLHHSLGHHVNYLDQAQDESRWRRADGSLMGEYEYSFNVALTAYPRAWAVGKRYPHARRVFFWMGLLTLALMIALVTYRPLPGFVVFVLAPAFSLWGTAWATYAHHSQRSTDSHFVASNNILQRAYNVVTGNLGYHTAHHYRPGVHWSQLPALHAQIAHQIPQDAYVAPGLPWRWFGECFPPQGEPGTTTGLEISADEAAILPHAS